MYGGSIMLTSESLAEMLAREVLEHPLNRLESGERVFDQPLVGIASASDSYFVEFKKPEIIGGFSRTPNEWLPGAKTLSHSSCHSALLSGDPITLKEHPRSTGCTVCSRARASTMT